MQNDPVGSSVQDLSIYLQDNKGLLFNRKEQTLVFQQSGAKIRRTPSTTNLLNFTPIFSKVLSLH